MTELSEESLDQFIAIMKKEGKTFASRDEARECATSLVEFYEILYEGELEEEQRKERLKKEPGGFALDGQGRRCDGCRRNIYDELWYDEQGIHCLKCHSK